MTLNLKLISGFCIKLGSGRTELTKFLSPGLAFVGPELTKFLVTRSTLTLGAHISGNFKYLKHFREPSPVSIAAVGFDHFWRILEVL
jgi:hypothetical protein